MIDVIRSIIIQTSPRRRKQFWLLTCFIAISGLVEMLALGSVALFVSSLASLDSFLQSQYIIPIRNYFGDGVLDDRFTIYMALGGSAVALFILKNIFIASSSYAIARFDGNLSLDYGNKLLNGVLNLPYEWNLDRNSSDTIQAIVWKQYVGLFSSHLLTMVGDCLVSVLLLSSLFVLEPMVTFGVVIALILIGVGAYHWLRGRIDVVSHNAAELTLSLSRLLMKSIQGIKDVKLFNSIKETVISFDNDSTSYVVFLAVQRLLERCPVLILETTGVAGLVAGALVMMLVMDASSLQVMGTLTLFAVSAWRVLPAVSRMVSGFTAMRGYLPYLRRVLQLVDEIEANMQQGHERIQEVPLSSIEDELSIRDVSFRYQNSETQILKNLSITIKAGTMVGIVGRSGAGKSTLADLLIGLITPQSGGVFIDGTQLTPSVQKSWFSQVGFVPQTPYLFDGSIAENVAFTTDKNAICAERLQESCEQAGVLEFVDCLPDRLDTAIGERGVRLSGGQAQRVSIARALYRDPCVLIFDEATSSLDNHNERIIRDTIMSLRSGRTMIIIAHRMDTVRQSDLIIWMEKGKVVASGPPESILPEYEAAGCCDE